MMKETINRKPLIDGFSEEGDKPAGRAKGAVSLQDVVFSYPSRPNILVCDGYNLEIEAGQTVALCGASGAGKSTIINLLLRFYDPSAGVVKLDGTDIRTLNVRWLRAQMGYVGQEPVLFAGTILDNIAYGIDVEALQNRGGKESYNQKTLKDLVVAAARLSNANDFIEAFPSGYETDVGSNGSALSGGQKQRIAIARALVKRPAVLLLDEATSALDYNSEKLVQESIDRLQESKMQTTIVIAHRLSTIRNADKIAVVEKGRVAELGTHDELLALEGRYFNLVKLQMDGKEDNEESKTESSKYDGEAPPEQSIKVDTGRPRNESKSRAKSASAPDAVEIPPVQLSKEESTKAGRRVWAMVMRQPLWFSAGVLGAVIFGGIFPVWGLVLAKAQAMFFNTTAHVLRHKAAWVALYFILMAFGCIVSNLLQYWCIGRVRKRYIL